MADDSKYPKAAQLRRQREEAYEAERVRQKAEAELERQREAISVKRRNKTQHNYCKDAEAKVAAKRSTQRKTPTE